MKGISLDAGFMMEALKEAIRAEEEGEVPVGAVLVQEGKVIAREHNRCIQKNDPTAHAEILALRYAGEKIKNYRLPGITLFATIEPCPMCAGAILNSRIKRVVYGARDPKSGSDGSVVNILRNRKFNHMLEVVRGIKEDECIAVLRDFFLKKRKKNKN
ncbi:MAG TPA: tRNA adenosine(34) deaminase TadA [bacterium]